MVRVADGRVKPSHDVGARVGIFGAWHEATLSGGGAARPALHSTDQDVAKWEERLLSFNKTRPKYGASGDVGYGSLPNTDVGKSS